MLLQQLFEVEEGANDVEPRPQDIRWDDLEGALGEYVRDKLLAPTGQRVIWAFGDELMCVITIWLRSLCANL